LSGDLQAIITIPFIATSALAVSNPEAIYTGLNPMKEREKY
jgi:hypothetical protein